MSIVSRTLVKSRNLRLESSRPHEAIGHLLKNLHHSLRQAVDEAFRRERVRMSFAHFVTLYSLSIEPGVAGAELARRGFVTAQTMNTILRRMEKDGDIERRPHPGNTRADSWFITRSGQVRLDRGKVIGDAVWMRMLSALKTKEVAQLQNLLERCIVGLDVQVEGSAAPKKGSAAAATRKRVAKAARSRRL